MAEKRLNFEKYSSTGNDFIIFDVMRHDFTQYELTFWRNICHRQTGIGADGVLLIGKGEGASNILMRYFNADGNEEAMCGNGARAAVHFANEKYDLEDTNNISLKTMNGIYHASLKDNEVQLRMSEISLEQRIDISELFESEYSFFISTGVPHCVYKVKDVDEVNLLEMAPPIRHNKKFRGGVNINIYEELSKFHLKVRTFERGVEGETLACGTGAVAMAIAAFRDSGEAGTYRLETKGGELKVKLNHDLTEVYLTGPTVKTFEGSFEIAKFCG